MGMFDYIRSEYPLPDGAPFPVDSTSEMQTKSLDCVMDYFIIGTDGRLRREECRWVDNPDYVELTQEEIDALTPIEWLSKPMSGWLERTGNLIEYVDEHGKPFHGIVNMYGYNHDKDNDYTFADYRVVFTHGVVEEIEYLESKR